MIIQTAMILAAGRGERLKPLTDSLPKALCTVHDVPLIEHHVMNLAQAGVKRVIINHAYLGGQIRQHLGHGERFRIDIIYAPEPPGGLETGGGIVNALPLLGEAPFLTVNADIFTDFDFASIKLPMNSSAHLILVNKPIYSKKGDFGLTKQHQLDNHNQQYTFSGIACYHPHLFKNNKPGRYSVTPILRQLAQDKQATGELYTGTWFDIGTIERLAQAQRAYQ